MADTNDFEKGPETQPSAEKQMLVVQQPEKIESLLSSLDDIESFSERIGEDRSGDMGGAGTGTGGTKGDDQAQVSIRDKAIANLPAEEVMQIEIQKHIKKEVKDLRRQVRKVEHIRKPGAAQKLNEIYARIRRLNGLLSEILESSYEVVKRLFVRIFIDKQSIS